ncbi:hypothetical protein [Nitrogeniibacter aestuarii]|uniref:hypothetical protein n=1 Tax=Nitrogeniibacter aestuarii TaxID=2815343 RepID=UPI001E4E787E|nr:hypothetical protein [Nitrogeniibacter aestuarii]
MLLRTIFLVFTLTALPAAALEIQRSVSSESDLSTATRAVSTKLSSIKAPDPEESPISGYGLALATLALIGFMSRR